MRDGDWLGASGDDWGWGGVGVVVVVVWWCGLEGNSTPNNDGIGDECVVCGNGDDNICSKSVVDGVKMES